MSGTAHEKFSLALTNALRADATLVTLTTHTGTNHHISRGKPDKAAQLPFLGHTSFTSGPALSEATASFRASLIKFSCSALDDLTAMKIADRIEALLLATGEPADNDYWDISDTEITTKMVRWVRTMGPEKDDDTDSWRYEVFAEFHWIDVPCTP